MTLLHQAAQKAVEALKYMLREKSDYMRRNKLGDPSKEWATKLVNEAIEALESALQQQPEPAAHQISSPEIPEGCEMARGWCVNVEVFGESILTLSDRGYSGLSEIEPWASTIRGCAQHLLSFIGPADDDAPALQHQEVPSTAVIPPAPPECETEDEKTAFAFGYWQGLHAARKGQEVPREPVAWLNPSSGKTCSADEKFSMENHQGMPGKAVAAHFSDPLYASPSTTRQQEVGREPTSEQMMAGYAVACSFKVYEAQAFKLAEEMYRAMLAAAPSTPANAGGGAACGACPDDRSTCKAECLLAAESPPVPAAEWLKCHRCGEPWNRGAEPFGHACSAQAGRFDDDWAPNPNDDQGTPGAPSPVSQTPPPLGTDGGTPQ